jgi:hypothetical protein
MEKVLIVLVNNSNDNLEPISIRHTSRLFKLAYQNFLTTLLGRFFFIIISIL